MTDRGFDLHPEAAQDIIEIWEYIAADSPQAAKRVREEILGGDSGAGAISTAGTQAARSHQSAPAL